MSLNIHGFPNDVFVEAFLLLESEYRTPESNYRTPESDEKKTDDESAETEISKGYTDAVIRFYMPPSDMLKSMKDIYSKIDTGKDLNYMDKDEEASRKKAFLTQDTPFHSSDIYRIVLNGYRALRPRKEDMQIATGLSRVSNQIVKYANNAAFTMQDYTGSVFTATKIWNFNDLLPKIMSSSSSQFEFSSGYTDLEDLRSVIKKAGIDNIERPSASELVVNGFRFVCDRRFHTSGKAIGECSCANIYETEKEVFYRDNYIVRESHRFVVLCVAKLLRNLRKIGAIESVIMGWYYYYQQHGSDFSNDFIIICEQLRRYLPYAYFSEYITTAKELPSNDEMRHIWHRMRIQHSRVDPEDIKSFSYVNCQPWLDYEVSLAQYVIGTYLALGVIGNLKPTDAELAGMVSDPPADLVERTSNVFGGLKKYFRIHIDVQEFDEMDTRSELIVTKKDD